MTPLKDPVCGRTPEQIEEYQYMAHSAEVTPETFVQNEEGTLDPSTGQFLCTDCYIKYGMPSSPGGWRATPNNVRDLLGL